MIAIVKPPAVEPRPGSVAWWRERNRSGIRTGRPRANGLSLDRIFVATVAILEDEGLEAVTMRRIADHLGTGPASLYRHVSGRDELLVLLTDRLLATEVSVDEEAVDWRTGCERIAKSFRERLLRSPALAVLAAQGQMLGPNSLLGRERVLCWLIDQEFSASLAVHTYLLLTRFVIGSLSTYDRSSKQDPGERDELVLLFKELDPAEFPTLVAVANQIGGQRPEDEFELGLTALLDGIAASREREHRQ
jgi:AcrR family transcriptional regulator